MKVGERSKNNQCFDQLIHYDLTLDNYSCCGGGNRSIPADQEKGRPLFTQKPRGSGSRGATATRNVTLRYKLSF